MFFLDEKEAPERVNGFSLRLSGCFHTSRIKLRALMTLTRVLSQKGVFIVFFLNQKQWLAVSGLPFTVYGLPFTVYRLRFFSGAQRNGVFLFERFDI